MCDCTEEQFDKQKILNFIDGVEKEHPYKVYGDAETYSQYNEAWCDALDRVRGFIDRMIEDAPTIDAVPRSVVDQIRWERDMAIGQLEEIGVGFCEKTDDVVKVIRCKDCLHYRQMVSFDGECMCDVFEWKAEPMDYCSFAERKEVQE